MAGIGTYEGNDGKPKDLIGVADLSTSTPPPGTGATGLGKAEDAAHTTGDVGVGMLGVRTPETPAAQTTTDGDYGFVALDQYGDVKTLMVDPDGVPLEPLPSGRAAAASSTPTVLATEDFNEIKRASTGTKANVGDAITSTTLLAANTSRKLAVIVNDSTAILYVDATGGTASATSYTHQLPGTGGGTPASLSIADYTGLITGIWASDAGGSARVSEFT